MASISRVRANTTQAEESAPTAPTDEDEGPSGFTTGFAPRRRASDDKKTEYVKADYLVLRDNGKRIVKVLDAQPIRFQRHYINSRGGYTTCALPKDECPLSQAGHPFAWGYMLNVVDLKNDPQKVVTWTFGPEVATQLQDIIEDAKIKGLDSTPIDHPDVYFEVYHYKVEGRTAPSTKVNFTRAKYLEDEYGLLPLNEEELAELGTKRYGKSSVFISTPSYLEKIADELTPNDFPKKRN